MAANRSVIWGFLILIFVLLLCCFGPFSGCGLPTAGFWDNWGFKSWECQPHAQTVVWWVRVSLFVQHLPQNLSGLGGPTSSRNSSWFQIQSRNLLEILRKSTMALSQDSLSLGRDSNPELPVDKESVLTARLPRFVQLRRSHWPN